MRKFLYFGNCPIQLCFLFGLALIISCQSEAQRQRQLFSADQAANYDLGQINTDLNNRSISPVNFEKLRSLRAKYPDLPEIANSYKAALVCREDWTALKGFFESAGHATLSRDDKILLARSLVKLGSFAEGKAILQKIGPQSADDLEYFSLSALIHFNLEECIDAGNELDPIWPMVVSQKRIDIMDLRGMIYFRLKDYDNAISTLQRSLEINKQDPVATNTLSRIYSAMGDTARAEQYRRETEQAQAKMTDDENKKMKFVDLSRKLNEAWQARRYQDVIAIADQMLPLTDETNKPALQKFIEGARAELTKQNNK